MTKSDTPRTDALMERLEREAKPYNYRWHDWSDLARSLERELAVCRAVTALCCERTPQPEERRRIKGHVNTSWENSPEGNKVTLWFDCDANMHVFLRTVKTPFSYP